MNLCVICSNSREEARRIAFEVEEGGYEIYHKGYLSILYRVYRTTFTSKDALIERFPFSHFY